MQRKYQPVRVMLFVSLIGILSSCVDTSEELSGPDNSPLASLHATQVQAISQEDAELRELTRRLAIALGSDPALRTSLITSLSTSPFPEEKRHLRTLITQAEPAMLAGIARAGNRSVESVVESLDKIVDLEVYIPVEEHRSRWRGGSDLIVASAIADDPSVPIHAYDLGGEPVGLSWSAPPSTPVLAVVPSETDFVDRDAPETLEANLGSPGVSIMAMPPASVVMTRMEIDEDWEGWLMGDPEFQVHVTDQAGKYMQCVGRRKGTPRKLDMDSEVWTGEVMLESNYAPGNRYFEAWEDDSDPCDADGGTKPKTTSDIKKIITGTGTTVAKIIEASTASGWEKKL